MSDIALNINLLLCFMIFFMVPHLRGRRNMLFGNVAVCSLFSLYFWGQGETSAMLATFIAATSSVIQASIPEKSLDKTLRFRLLIALVMVILAASVSLRSYYDIIPLLGVIVSRFSETLKSQQMMRALILVPVSLWMYFALAKGMYGLAAGEFLVAMSIIYAVTKEYLRTHPMPHIPHIIPFDDKSVQMPLAPLGRLRPTWAGPQSRP